MLAVALVCLAAACKVTTPYQGESMQFGHIDDLPGGGFVASNCWFDSAYFGPGVMVALADGSEHWLDTDMCGRSGSNIPVATGPDGAVYFAWAPSDPSAPYDQSLRIERWNLGTGARTVVLDIPSSNCPSQ